MRRGKYSFINRDHPQAAGVCDAGGEVRKHADLMREMVWSARGLIWNGFLCCAEHIDMPHDQDRVRTVKPDPVPVQNPRPIQPMTVKDGFLADGTPTPLETGSIVTDKNGRPVQTKRFGAQPTVQGKFIE